MTSTTASVWVAVDPATAFTAFTDELDLWWVRGPINYFDAAKAVGMRCEPGIGGRLLEVYNAATGEGKELGRITIWEPSPPGLEEFGRRGRDRRAVRRG